MVHPSQRRMKMSREQKALLAAMAEQGVTLQLVAATESRPAYYFRSDNGRVCTIAARVLLKNGLARQSNGKVVAA